MSDLCDRDNFVRIRYAGPTGNHVVPSPLRKVNGYGMHTRGQEFCVHFDDQRAAPNIFVLVKDEPEPVVPAPAEPEAEPTEEPVAEEEIAAVAPEENEGVAEAASPASDDAAGDESDEEDSAKKPRRRKKNG